MLKILNKVLDLNVILVILTMITIMVSLQQYFLGERYFWDAMRPQYNNYLIFKYAFSHLLDGLNLYHLHPTDHGDYFKYSPTFALFMGLFYYLPDWLGIILWNLLNVFVLYAGVRLLPGIDKKIKSYILLFVLLELVVNIQNEQSNALMAGLFLLMFIAFEKEQTWLAAMFLVAGIYIKLFAVVGAILFIFYPKKIKFLLASAAWLLVFGIAPLIVISPAQMIEQYLGWKDILLTDHNLRYGFSVLGILHTWFGIDPSKIAVLLIGFLLFLLPFFRQQLFTDYQYRLLGLASLLIWVVLFNHMAESSGYVIAMTGCALWYFTSDKNVLNTVLIVFAFVFVSVSTTDLTPSYLHDHYVYPYHIKAIPVIVIWVKLMFDMLRMKINADGNKKSQLNG